MNEASSEKNQIGSCGIAGDSGSEQHHSLLCSLAARWHQFRQPARSKMSAAKTEEIRSAVEDLYSRVATSPDGKFEFNRGRDYAIARLGYDAAELAAIPETSAQSFAGVANLHLIDPVSDGEVVLDVGSGAGMDLLLAARRVGSKGRAIGVDMTDEMIKVCRASIEQLGLQNVEVRKGNAEHLPVDDATVDVVLSNGVLNLVPDKEQAFREIHRVLRPGGRLLLGDIVVSTTLLQKIVPSAALWAVCVAGATTEKDLVETVKRNGFDRINITRRFDCIRGTSKEFLARWLGVRGVGLNALKPMTN